MLSNCINKIKVVVIIQSFFAFFIFSSANARTYNVENILLITVPDSFIAFTAKVRSDISHELIGILNEIKDFDSPNIDNFMLDDNLMFRAVSQPFGTMINIYKLPYNLLDVYKNVINNFNLCKQHIDKENFTELKNGLAKLDNTLIKYTPSSLSQLDGFQSLVFSAVVKNNKNGRENLNFNYIIPLTDELIHLQMICKNKPSSLIELDIIKKSIRWIGEKNITKQIDDINDNLNMIKE